jgi:hypothetical protein
MKDHGLHHPSGMGWCHECAPNTVPVSVRIDRQGPRPYTGRKVRPDVDLPPDKFRVGTYVSFKKFLKDGTKDTWPILRGQLWMQGPAAGYWTVITDDQESHTVHKDDLFGFRSCMEEVPLDAAADAG